jgi:hypothetical protein
MTVVEVKLDCFDKRWKMFSFWTGVLFNFLFGILVLCALYGFLDVLKRVYSE